VSTPQRPLVARDDVGADLLVRRAEMGPAVDVVDGGGQKNRSRALRLKGLDRQRLDFLDRAVGRGREPDAVLEFGRGVDDAAVRQATLNRTAPTAVSTVTISRRRHSRSTSWCRSPIVVVSRKTMSAIAGRSAGGATIVSSVPRPVLFHLDRNVEHLQRTRAYRRSMRRRRSAGSCRRSRTRSRRRDRFRPPPRRARRGSEDVRRRREIALSRPIPDLFNRHRRNRPERRPRSPTRSTRRSA
jgi:hypothetical protein